MKREPITDLPYKTMESIPNKVDKEKFQKSISNGMAGITPIGEFPLGAVVPRPKSANHENTDASPRMNHRAFQ